MPVGCWTISINEKRPIFHYSTSWQEQYQCKSKSLKRNNQIIKQFCKTNKFDLIENSNIKYQKLYGTKTLHLNDAGKPLLANSFIKCFINVWQTICSDGHMSSPYQRNDENQSKLPASSSNTDKIKDSDLEALAKSRRDYPSNHMIGYLIIKSIKNKIVQLTD